MTQNTINSDVRTEQSTDTQTWISIAKILIFGGMFIVGLTYTLKWVAESFLI